MRRIIYIEQILLKQFNIFMKTNYLTPEYITPEVEILSTVVEQGFSASFGDFGEAGAGFDIDDNGDF